MASSNTSELLYERCIQNGPHGIYHQNDLESLNITKDVSSLLAACQELSAKHLFQVMTWEGRTCWKMRTREEAAKMRSMAPDDRLIYSQIEASGNTGIWTKLLKTKTNLPQTVVSKSLKSMKAKGLVKDIVHAKFPARKVFMLAHLEPSEDVSGGPWHADGELDEGLVETLSNFIVQYIRTNSWAEQPGPSKADIKKKKEVALKTVESSRSVEHPRFKPPLGPNRRPLIPYPPSWQHYPTTRSVLNKIMESGILNNIDIPEGDLQSLIDTLVWDGRLERMGAMGYRTVRDLADPAIEDLGNGLTEAPCGRCPVFDLCEEGGPVSAANCVYFEEWLLTMEEREKRVRSNRVDGANVTLS